MKKKTKKTEFQLRVENAKKIDDLRDQAIRRSAQLAISSVNLFRAGDEEGYLKHIKAANDELSKALEHQAEWEEV